MYGKKYSVPIVFICCNLRKSVLPFDTLRCFRHNMMSARVRALKRLYSSTVVMAKRSAAGANAAKKASTKKFLLLIEGLHAYTTHTLSRERVKSQQHNERTSVELFVVGTWQAFVFPG